MSSRGCVDAARRHADVCVHHAGGEGAPAQTGPDGGWRRRRGLSDRRRRSGGGWGWRISLAAVAWTMVLGAASAWARSSPHLYTNASPSTMVGLQVFDHTNLTGGAGPTGRISFALFAPADAGCASPIFASTVPVSGTGSDDSTKYATPAAGTYQWIASYSGDQNNNPTATLCGDAGQSVAVSKQYVGTALSISQAGGVIHATLALWGGFAPGGTATFTVTGPDDQFCSGPAAFVSTVAVKGPGRYDSGAFEARRPGQYTVRLRYDGDPNNYGAGPSACLDSTASVAVAQALFVHPTEGQTLDTTTPLSWSPVSGAQQYGLTMGTSRGGRDLVNIGLSSTTSSFAVSMLPTGRTIYARLSTMINGAWVGYDDVAFTTDGAVFTGPLDGQTTTATRLNWTGVAGAAEYGLWIGTGPAKADLVSLHLSSSTLSYDGSKLPIGVRLYARIWTEINGVWARFEDISFSRAVAADGDSSIRRGLGARLGGPG